MARKRTLKKGASNRKGRKKYFNGGQAYALPTSAAATTSNMMGMGDPNLLNNQLQQSNEALAAQREKEQMATAQSMAERAAQSQAQFNAAVDTGKQNLSGEGLKQSIQSGADAYRLARIGKGTANAAQVAKASSDTTQLLANLGNYGQQAQSAGRLANAGQAIGQGVKAMGPGAAAAGLGIGGAAVKHFSDDNDPTKLNFGESAGTLLQGAGTGLGAAQMLGLMGAVPGIGWAAAGIGALGYGAHALIQKKKAKEEQEKIDEQNALARQQTSRAQSEAFNNAFTKTGADLGYNVGNALTNSYTPSQQIMYKDGGQLGDPHKRMLRKQNRETRRAQRAYERASKKANRKGISPYKDGGEMIKRADGSYSPRGLWDNIRANQGSGKKPTKEMLEQERKIKAEEKKKGGYMKALPGNAVEFVGPKHKDGGIMLDPQTEVEGGETMDKVNMSANKASDYIFSDYLKLGGKTFAKRHKEILKRGGGEAKVQSEIQRLAKMQEEVARRNGEKDRTPDKVMRDGGVKKYQTGDTYNPWAFGSQEDWAYQARPVGTGIDMEGIVGGRDYGDIGDTIFSDYYSSGPGALSDAEGKMFADDRDQWYSDVYTPRVNKFFQESPDQAYEYLQTMAQGDDPNADNFRRKLLDAEGNMLPKEQALQVAQQLATDKKIGSFHMYLPGQIDPLTPKGPKQIETSYERPDINRETTPVTPPGGKKPPRDLGWMAALPGLLQLGKNDPYPQARTIGAEANRMVNLPRVNFNAERAANQATNIGTKRMFANQAAGPGGMAAALASDAGARAQNIQIANQEARTNKDLMAQEASINANIGQQNAARAQQAAQYNAANLQQMDVNRHEQNIYNRQHRADVMTGVARDIMAYKSDERLANAISDSGAYERLTAQERARLRGLVGEEKETAKKGGYIKRSNKIRRKRRK
jgi:hypothetical protein